MESRFAISRVSRSVSCAASSFVNPPCTSRFPWNRTAQASGRRAFATSVSVTRLLRPSAGSGARRIRPSRSMRTSICAMEGCSILANRARSRCVFARPLLSAIRTGRYPIPNPNGFRRASLNRANPRAARLIKCPGVDSTSTSLTFFICIGAYLYCIGNYTSCALRIDHTVPRGTSPVRQT